MYEVWHYVTPAGKVVVEDWLDSLRDPAAEARIAARIARLVSGNFGDCKPVGEGVYELRVDYGPGYRVYYAMAGRRVVLILCGGDKRRQTADIKRAEAYWADYQRRTAKP